MRRARRTRLIVTREGARKATLLQVIMRDLVELSGSTAHFPFPNMVEVLRVHAMVHPTRLSGQLESQVALLGQEKVCMKVSFACERDLETKGTI